MLDNYLYVFVDRVSHHTITRGVGLRYFSQAIKKMPQNILLLAGSHPLAQRDEYTRFFTVRGAEAVREFIQQQEQEEHDPKKWVDFSSYELLHQLNDGELAELLYLAHMRRHLHAPFFYKLQNRYVVLPLGRQMDKIYYHDINEFYWQLSQVLVDRGTGANVNLTQQVFSWLRPREKSPAPEGPTLEVMKALAPLLQEGLIFDLTDFDIWDSNSKITLYLAEDDWERVVNQPIARVPLGTLSYNKTSQDWKLNTEPYERIYGG